MDIEPFIIHLPRRTAPEYRGKALQTAGSDNAGWDYPPYVSFANVG
jgi:hypothetical protein